MEQSNVSKYLWQAPFSEGSTCTTDGKSTQVATCGELYPEDIPEDHVKGSSSSQKKHSKGSPSSQYEKDHSEGTSSSQSPHLAFPEFKDKDYNKEDRFIQQL
ncbi:hypothetical protein ARMSODRAFT_973823 [Armillaria solidipes]|uniref:Uncharacterized protein n=1 Tax=Armillaria solidipes TaxID=1076256 RepID=A0A2H3BWN5_9AGAR|nr:hypothetical protein ARMSODRAFT_973823 [Armillaria solidipes]